MTNSTTDAAAALMKRLNEIPSWDPRNRGKRTQLMVQYYFENSFKDTSTTRKLLSFLNDSSGNVYVADSSNNRIQKFSLVPDNSIPEVPFGVALALVSMAAALAGLIAFKRIRTKYQFL